MHVSTGTTTSQFGGLQVPSPSPKQDTWPEFFSRSGTNLWTERSDNHFIARTLVGLGAPFLRWWVQAQLSPQRQLYGASNRSPCQVPASELWGFVLNPNTRFEFFPLGDTRVVAVAATYGWQYRPAENRFVAASPSEISFSRLSKQESRQPLGAINEPKFALPDIRDPRIFEPHFGTGQLYCTPADQLWEGRDDAACALRYLKAYDRLIQKPTARNLYRATINPRPETGPAFRVFRFTIEEGVSPQFLSLMFTAFTLHYIAQRVEAITPRDCYPVFGALLAKYIQDHR